jgi:uncharacterized protein (DUF305 family)
MKRVVLALVLAAGLAALPACAAEPGAPAVPGSPAPARGPVRAAAGAFNAADVMFLQMMIPHQRQGMEMADLARTRAVREEVRTMAAAVEAAQGDETRTMTAWLIGWGKPLTAPAHAHDAHGGLHATSPGDIAALRTMTGAGFESTYLNVLLAHQHNAIDMARTENRTGMNAEVKGLARRIDQSRTAQVKQMLQELSPPMP